MQKFDKGIQKMWQIKPRSVSHILGKVNFNPEDWTTPHPCPLYTVTHFSRRPVLVRTR